MSLVKWMKKVWHHILNGKIKPNSCDLLSLVLLHCYVQFPALGAGCMSCFALWLANTVSQIIVVGQREIPSIHILRNSV